jgi:hypothetical protein
VATVLRSRCDWLVVLQVVKQLLGGFGCQILLQQYGSVTISFSQFTAQIVTYKVVVVDSKNRSVNTCTCAFNFNQCEFPILGGFTNLKLQVVLDGFKNFGGSASTKLARCGSTQLQEVLANRFSSTIGQRHMRQMYESKADLSHCV